MCVTVYFARYIPDEIFENYLTYVANHPTIKYLSLRCKPNLKGNAYMHICASHTCNWTSLHIYSMDGLPKLAAILDQG